MRFLCLLKNWLPRAVAGSGDLMGVGTFVLWVGTAIFAWGIFTQPFGLEWNGEDVTLGEAIAVFVGISFAFWVGGRTWIECATPRFKLFDELERDPDRKMFRLRYINKGPGGSTPKISVEGLYGETGFKLQYAQFPIHLHISHKQEIVAEGEEGTAGVFDIKQNPNGRDFFTITGKGVPAFLVGEPAFLPHTLYLHISCRPSEVSKVSERRWFKLRYDHHATMKYSTEITEIPSFFKK